jgi:hypothetical protein
MKYLWDRPGVGDDWESTWRSEAWQHLIEQGLRDAGLHLYTRQYQTNMACNGIEPDRGSNHTILPVPVQPQNPG